MSDSTSWTTKQVVVRGANVSESVTFTKNETPVVKQSASFEIASAGCGSGTIGKVRLGIRRNGSMEYHEFTGSSSVSIEWTKGKDRVEIGDISCYCHNSKTGTDTEISGYSWDCVVGSTSGTSLSDGSGDYKLIQISF